MFQAPIRDLAFALDVAGLPALARDTHPDLDTDTLQAVLDEAGRFATEVLAPLNREGDRVGARFENGQVRAAPGFAAALKAYGEGGWAGLSAAPEHGGQGLPKAVSIAVFEMMHAANMAFGLCPMLTEAAVEAVAVHGTDRQKALYLPPMVEGRWTGCMNLTEPQAGSDLSQVRSTAEPDGEGAYRLTGQKIYITWGDHDAADNICPPRAGPPARRAAGGDARHQPVPRAQAAGGRGRARGRRQRRLRPAAWSTSSASTARPPASCCSRAPRPSWWDAGEPGPRRHVHHDERRAPQRRRGGRRDRRAGLPAGARPSPASAGRAARPGAPSAPAADLFEPARTCAAP